MYETAVRRLYKKIQLLHTYVSLDYIGWRSEEERCKQFQHGVLVYVASP